MKARDSKARSAWLWTPALGLVLIGGAASADTVTLNNGREIHGRLIEEGAEAIQIRTGSGVITIPKANIATFSENENWGFAKPRTVRELRAIEQLQNGGQGGPADPAGPPPGPGGKPTPPAAGGKGAGAEAWAWDSGVSAETRERLTPIRDELLKQLEGLGPTKEERLAALKLSREEEPDLKEKVRLLGWKRRRGSRGGTAGSSVYRDRARTEIASAYGVRAIESLVKVLDSDNLWQVRTALETMADILKDAKSKEDARWYMAHFGAPSAIAALLDNEGDLLSPFVRLEASQGLAEILGASAEWPQDVTTALRTPAETEAARKWRRLVAKAQVAFTKGEEDKVTKRKELEEKLELVRTGKDPEEAPAEDK